MRAINLIPSEQRSGQPVGAGRSQGGAYGVLVLVAGLALMAFLYGQAQHQATSSRAQVASIAAQAQQAQVQAERLAPYTSFIALREQRVQAVDSLVNSRFDWAHVLHEFARVLPANASISALSGTVGQTSATGAATPGAATASAAAGSSGAGATPPGSVPTFTLNGCATSQTAVASTLVRLRLIDGVKEVTLQSSTAGASGSTASSGSCSGHDASFAATVIFDSLPSSAAVAAASKTVSDSTNAASPTTPGASAK